MTDFENGCAMCGKENETLCYDCRDYLEVMELELEEVFR